MNKKILHHLLALLLLFGVATTVNAQVTIGNSKKPESFSVLELTTSNTKGGLRLPHLSTTERDALNFANLPSGTPAQQATKAQAVGLSIYNTDTKCVEYWNDSKWISLCTGQAGIYFEDENGNKVDPTKDPFPPAGEEKGSFFPKDEPNCTGKIPPFDYVIITGNDFTRISLINNSNGEFKISMDPNTTARSRMAIVRVTNNCTAEYSEFLFTQEGDATVCKPGTKPEVEVSNGGKICNGGAVYMYIKNPENVPYVWTLNDVELTEAAGKHYHWATQPGTYRIYIGGVGCDVNASERVITKMDTGSAGESVGSVIATNNGTICGAGNKTTLTALNIPTAGTLKWYKNGKLEAAKMGTSITLTSADVGDWFAVMVDGSCTSKASNVITVKEELSSTSLPNPDVYVNGSPLASATFCKGGYLTLKLNNKAAYDALGIGVTVKWYNGTILVGTGDEIVIVAPNEENFLLRCVVSDNTGSRCTAEAIESKGMSSTAPRRPGILGNPFICGPRSATLSVSGGQSGYSYQWFKEGSSIAAANTVSYTTANTGVYSAQMTDGNGCLSPMSTNTEIKTSDLSILQFVNPVTAAEPNSTHTYQVMGSHDPMEYIWSITGSGALLDAETTGNTMRVLYNNVSSPETATLSVTAKNACGLSKILDQLVNVAPACTPVSNVHATISATGDVTAGSTITMGVSAVGSTPMTYQWFRGTTSLPGATSDTHTVSNAQTIDGGEYKVVVKNACTTTGVTAIAGTVKVIDVSTTPVGDGTLSGENCYDLVLSPANFNQDCGLQAGRDQNKADFTSMKVYTFKNIGTANKNLRFIVEDPLGLVTSNTQSGKPAPAAVIPNGGTYTISLQFNKAKVEADGYGTTDNDALKLKVIALYDVAGVTQKAELEITIKDCQCCGANGIPGTLIVGANKYLTHKYGDDCWMVSNSKEGTAYRTTYPGKQPGERGYYYKRPGADAACPLGWTLPTPAQFNEMHQENLQDVKAQIWWNGTVSSGGLLNLNTNVFQEWSNTWQYFMTSDNSTSQLRASVSLDQIYIQKNTNSNALSIRCVRKRTK